jgi:hypothetical protein
MDEWVFLAGGAIVLKLDLVNPQKDFDDAVEAG